jgi:hypothetical protein
MPNSRYKDYTNLSIKVLNVLDPEAMILVKEDKLAYLGFLMTNWVWKLGWKILGREVRSACSKEMTQLHDMQTFIPHNSQSLTQEEWVKALSLLIILKEMKNSNDKGQT